MSVCQGSVGIRTGGKGLVVHLTHVIVSNHDN
jgi:hypothetical protein